MQQIMISGLTEIEYRIKTAINRLKAFEPEEGYYLAFSGGKDSQCIYHLAKEAVVKFDAHYNVTGIDPPELVYFIRENYPDVSFDKPSTTMWKLIEKQGLPTRLNRHCCANLKEGGGEGRICVTGVRWAESTRRKANRAAFEVFASKKEDKQLFNDNDEDRRLFENCMQKGKRIVNPIIDWTTDDVWEYIHTRGLKYCKLYDEGFKRLGCIGCPMAQKGRLKQFERYPKFEAIYKRAMALYIPGYLQRCKQKGLEPIFKTVDEYWHWWIYGSDKDHAQIEGQIELDELA